MDAKLKTKFYQDGQPKKILSLDGGGVRGILTLGYLEKIEHILRQRENDPKLVLADYYDLIGGTSTGAIIASCLAIGKPVSEIIELYENLGKKVFGNRVWPIIPRNWTNFRAILKSTYKADIVESVLKNTLQEITLGDYNKFKCGLAIMSKRADSYSLWTVATHPDGIYTKAMSHLKLWELCRASSAAPYYFPPKKLTLKTRKGDSFEAAFIDGGVSLANNPSFQLFLTATVPSFGFNWESGQNRIFISSFGTGSGVNKETVRDIVNRRAISWASKIPELFMTDALEMNQVILQIFGKNYGSAESIDSQYHDLKDMNYGTEKLFSFARFNVKLTKEYLSKTLGITKTEKEIKSLVEMDHYENIKELLSIGRKAASSITEENFNFEVFPLV